MQLGIRPRELIDIMALSPASSALLRDDIPRVLDSDYMETFGLREIVEELDAVTALSSEHDAPGGLLELSAALHRAALDAVGAVDGELRVIDYLETIAGVSLRG